MTAVQCSTGPLSVLAGPETPPRPAFVKRTWFPLSRRRLIPVASAVTGPGAQPHRTEDALKVSRRGMLLGGVASTASMTGQLGKTICNSSLLFSCGTKTTRPRPKHSFPARNSLLAGSAQAKETYGLEIIEDRSGFGKLEARKGDLLLIHYTGEEWLSVSTRCGTCRRQPPDKSTRLPPGCRKSERIWHRIRQHKRPTGELRVMSKPHLRAQP